jgi:hypothetical protein
MRVADRYAPLPSRAQVLHTNTRIHEKDSALLPVRWSLVGSFFRPAPRPGNENSAAPSLRVSTEHVCNERQRRNFHNQ